MCFSSCFCVNVSANVSAIVFVVIVRVLIIGTQGTYASGVNGEYSKTMEMSTYISKYGIPATPKMIADDKVEIVCTPTAFNGRFGTPGEPSYGVPSHEKLDCQFSELENGLYVIKITSPDTLTYELNDVRGDYPPRWEFYMDSFGWYLFCQINTKDKLESDEFISLRASVESGHDTPLWKIAKQKSEVEALISQKRKQQQSQQSQSNPQPQVQKFFLGCALVFAERASHELKSIVTWQEKIYSGHQDDDDESWQKLIDNQWKVPYIHPIFRQYSNLYPIMRSIVNLDSYASVTLKLEALKRAFSAPYNSAHYMPVTRDLSGMNQVLCRLWLENPIYSTNLIDRYEMKGGFHGEIRTIKQLKKYLQCAIQLEMNTLPPYLSALYSMDPVGKSNAAIRQLITEITHEEMLHLCLACNLLLSITNDYKRNNKKNKNGKGKGKGKGKKKKNIDIPRIAFKDTARGTRFPKTGLLKNKTVRVLPHLKLELQPMSLDALKTFIAIEAPAKFEMNQPGDVKVDSNNGSVITGTGKNINYMGDNPSQGKGVVLDSKALREFITGKIAQKNDDYNNDVQATYVNNALKAFQKSNVNINVSLSQDKDAEKELYFLKKCITFTPYSHTELAKEEDEKKNDDKDSDYSDDDDDDDSDDDYPEIPQGGMKIKRANHSIGAFYELIRKGFIYLHYHRHKHGLKLFKSTREECIENQVGPELMPNSNYVFDLDTALTAITTIVSEGEGTSLTDIRSNSNQLSHFHRFVEMYYGKPILAAKLGEENKADASQRYTYEYIFAHGTDILKLDENKVETNEEAWDWLKLSNYQTQKHEYRKLERVTQFNETYGKLLICLQDIFGNGKKEYFRKAIALMRQLQINFEYCIRPKVLKSADPSPDDIPQVQYPPIAPDWHVPRNMLLD